MTTETYLYNKSSTVQTMLISAGFVAFVVYKLTAHTYAANDPNLWIMVALGLGSFIHGIYMYKVRLRPVMQGETALELTPEELFFRPKNITIPWKTISDISTKAANRSGSLQYLEIALNDATDPIRIDLDWVASDPVDIYTAVVNYLYETRKTAEKYSHS